MKREKTVKVGGELEDILREATSSVEQELKIEDSGWLNLSSGTGDIITANVRKENLLLSRLYYLKDPLAKQSIRLWTDYTFGTGMVWSADDEQVTEVLDSFWNARQNKTVLSPKGQRMSSDKLLVDGEVFFAVFLGNESIIRRIDPLEITEIITNPDDSEDVKYFRRDWSDNTGKVHTGIYRNITNVRDEAGIDMYGNSVKKTEDAIIYHLTNNTISQRGNPLLLPALDWIKQYRRFLASRIAVMLALARFAWRTKVTGGQAAVTAIKGKLDDKTPNAGSVLVENMGSDTTPIRTESGASSAYHDGRMIKMQICAAVGIPEQYFGDISIGNLATAKTVELPMMKMFQSYQAIWGGAYNDIDELILEHNEVPEDKWYVDRDFPAIAPEDATAVAVALGQILTVMPELAESDDVKQVALIALGVNDPAEVLDALSKVAKPTQESSVKLIKALREYKRSLE